VLAGILVKRTGVNGIGPAIEHNEAGVEQFAWPMFE
jgi:hypothetical protein